MADGVWKEVYPLIFGCSRQLVFDPSTPSMRKGRDGGEKQEKTGGTKENNDENCGH